MLLGLGAAGLRLLKNATGTALQENINALHILDSDDDEFAVASSATQSFAKDKLENGSEVIVVDDDKENVSPNGSLSVERKSLDSCSGDDNSDFMPNSTKKKTQKRKRVQESTPMEPFEQPQKKQQHTHSPSLQVAIPDITSVAEGQTFPVNKVEEVIQHVKQQAKAQNVQASVGKGASILSRSPVLYMVCSRAGYSAKNAAILNGKEYISKPKKSGSASDGSKTDTGISKPLQRRKSSSYKCGCEWKISFSFSRLDVGLMCRVTAVALQHTNGCNPSPLQYSIAKRRVGDGFMEIPKPLAVTLHIIFRGKRYHNTTVRELLREHGVVKRGEVITGMMIANLRAKLLTLDAE